MPFRHVPLTFCLLSACATLGGGCTSTKQSNTARTATEQLLISNAVDQSLNKVDFSPLAASAVFVEEKYIDCVDKGYIIGSIRHKLLQAGATLAAQGLEVARIAYLRQVHGADEIVQKSNGAAALVARVITLFRRVH